MQAMLRSPKARMAIALAAVGVFGLFTARQTLGHSLATTSPELLAQFHRYPVRAWAERAKRAVANSEDEARLRLGRSYAVTALRTSPVQAGALGTIAMVDAALGDQVRSDATLAIALKISRREPVVNLMDVARAVRSGDVNAMAESADIAMRANRGSGPDLWPALVQESVDPRFAKALAARLAANPVWRPGFLVSVGVTSDYPEAGKNLFLALKQMNAGPTAAEVTNYFTSAGRARGEISALRELWLKVDPAIDRRLVASSVYDGDFTGAGGGQPFNWSLADKYDLSARIERDGDRSWLAIRTSGDATGSAARQLIALKPGAYRFSLTHRTIDDLSSAALRVTVNCHDGKQIARQDLGATPQLRRFNMRFSVPAGCDGQWLSFSMPPAVDGIAANALAIDNVVIEAAN